MGFITGNAQHGSTWCMFSAAPDGHVSPVKYVKSGHGLSQTAMSSGKNDDIHIGILGLRQGTPLSTSQS